MPTEPVIAMEVLAREQDQEQPEVAEEQAGPYPIEQLQVSMPKPAWSISQAH